MKKTDVIFLFQDSQGISSNTVGNIKTVLKKMMTKLRNLLSGLKFAVAKYATSRQMSCLEAQMKQSLTWTTNINTKEAALTC